jgi:hypothetical protein
MEGVAMVASSSGQVECVAGCVMQEACSYLEYFGAVHAIAKK